MTLGRRAAQAFPASGRGVWGSGSHDYLLRLLGQTWRSVVSVLIAYTIVIGLLIYYPEILQQILHFAEGIRDHIIAFIGSETIDNPTAEVLARAIISEHSVSMILFFLFARVVVLTTILFLIEELWYLTTGRG